MSNATVPVVPKRNAVTGTGHPTSLALGELAVNTTTGNVYLGADPGVVQIGIPVAAGTTTNLGTGDGSTVAYTIAGGTGTDAGGYLVSVGGIDQPSGWTVAGTTLTFSEAPPAGAAVSVRAILKGEGGGGGTDIGGRAWSAGATYTQGDLVATSQRETWICIQNFNTGHDPTTSPTWWAPQPADAVSLQLNAVSTTAPTDGQLLMWSAANNQWEPTLLRGSVTFNTEGTHYWTIPFWVKSAYIDALAGNGSDGGATNGTDGEFGISSDGGFPTTGANGTDGTSWAGVSGKSIFIDSISFSVNGGTAGLEGLKGYGGGGSGGSGFSTNYTIPAANGNNGNGPNAGGGGDGANNSNIGGGGGAGGGGAATNGQSGAQPGTTMALGGIGDANGGNGGNGGEAGSKTGGGGGGGYLGSGGGGGGGSYEEGGITLAPGLPGKGGIADTSMCAGGNGQSFSGLVNLLFVAGTTVPITISAGAGTASITITY